MNGGWLNDDHDVYIHECYYSSYLCVCVEVTERERERVHRVYSVYYFSSLSKKK